MPNQPDYIELLIIGADGIRRKFVGYGELVEVDNLEPAHTQMMVVCYSAAILDPISQTEVARLRWGDTVAVYTHVRPSCDGLSFKTVATGAYRGHWIAESSWERMLPETKPSLSLHEDSNGEGSTAPG